MQPDLTNTRVLLVEDEYFLAREMMQTFESLGARVIGPAATPQAALSLAGNEPIDIAVLDLKLRGGTAYEVADLLEARDIPFVFATSYSAAEIPEAYRHVERWEKPVDAAEIAASLQVLTPHATPRRDVLSYRIIQEGATWRWELRRGGDVLQQGRATSRISATAAAFLASVNRFH